MTAPQPSPKSRSYQAVTHGLLRMHRLTLKGLDESDEADAIRESMNEPWESLSNAERDRVTGLSKDLYEISDNPARVTEPMNPQAQGKLNQAYEAREQGEWDRALELLRRWGKYVPPGLLSYLRGFIWREMGDAEVATVFFENASQLEPTDENLQGVLLDTLKTADPKGALERAEQVLKDSEARAPSVVIHATDIVLFGTIGRMAEVEAIREYKRLIPILERTLVRLEGAEDVNVPALKGMAFVYLAISYRVVGDVQRSLGYFSLAIQHFPMDDALLVSRGRLLYDTNPVSAAADFEQAVTNGSSLVWPYFYLAHYYLENNRFEECRVMCERALRRPASIRVQSELHLFLAIALARLGYQEPMIRGAFEKAIRVDPSNDRAGRNLERFNNALLARHPFPKDWERPTESFFRNFSQDEDRLDESTIRRGRPMKVQPSPT